MFKRNQLMMDSDGDVMILLRRTTKRTGIAWRWLMLNGKLDHPQGNYATHEADRDWIKDNFTPITKEVMMIMRKGV